MNQPKSKDLGPTQRGQLLNAELQTGSDPEQSVLAELNVPRSRFCPHEEHPAYQDFLKQCPSQRLRLTQFRKYQHFSASIGKFICLFLIPISLAIELSVYLYDGSWIPFSLADLIPWNLPYVVVVLDQPWFIEFSLIAAVLWMISGIFDYFSQQIEEELYS